MHRQDITIAKHFIKATKEILTAMACVTPQEGTPFVRKSGPQEGNISAIIGVTGMRTGTICVNFGREAAKELIVNMLGDDIVDEQKDMEDAVGEISNMISGKARASLDEEGLNMQGSTPTLITGSGHSVHYTASGPVIAIPFVLGKGSFTVEFCFEPVEPVEPVEPGKI